MRVTKNTLLIFLLVIIVVLVLYFYGGPIVDIVIKEKSNFIDGPGKKNSGWISTILTFSLGVGTGWLLFRKAK